MERDQAIARLKELFDHPVGSIGLHELMDVKETASPILGRKADIHDPAQPAPGVA